MLQELKAILSCLASSLRLSWKMGSCSFSMMPPSGTASADFRKKSRKLHKRKGQNGSLPGTQWAATVHCLAAYQLVLLQAQQSEPTQEESQILSAAARALRRPLQKMFLTASQLFPYLRGFG